MPLRRPHRLLLAALGTVAIGVAVAVPATAAPGLPPVTVGEDAAAALVPAVTEALGPALAGTWLAGDRLMVGTWDAGTAPLITALGATPVVRDEPRRDPAAVLSALAARTATGMPGGLDSYGVDPRTEQVVLSVVDGPGADALAARLTGGLDPPGRSCRRCPGRGSRRRTVPSRRRRRPPPRRRPRSERRSGRRAPAATGPAAARLGCGRGSGAAARSPRPPAAAPATPRSPAGSRPGRSRSGGCRSSRRTARPRRAPTPRPRAPARAGRRPSAPRSGRGCPAGPSRGGRDRRGRRAAVGRHRASHRPAGDPPARPRWSRPAARGAGRAARPHAVRRRDGRSAGPDRRRTGARSSGTRRHPHRRSHRFRVQPVTRLVPTRELSGQRCRADPYQSPPRKAGNSGSVDDASGKRVSSAVTTASASAAVPGRAVASAVTPTRRQ